MSEYNLGEHCGSCRLEFVVLTFFVTGAMRGPTIQGKEVNAKFCPQCGASQ